MGGMNEWGVCAKRNGFKAWREGKKEGALKLVSLNSTNIYWAPAMPQALSQSTVHMALNKTKALRRGAYLLVGGTESEQADTQIRSFHTVVSVGMKIKVCQGGDKFCGSGGVHGEGDRRRDHPFLPQGTACPPARPHRRSWFSAPQAPSCPSIPRAAKLGAPGSLAAMPPPLLLFFLLFLTPEGVRPQKTLLVEAKGMSRGYRWKELGLETWVCLGALGLTLPGPSFCYL